jgi:hypothetical protein
MLVLMTASAKVLVPMSTYMKKIVFLHDNYNFNHHIKIY